MWQHKIFLLSVCFGTCSIWYDEDVSNSIRQSRFLASFRQQFVLQIQSKTCYTERLNLFGMWIFQHDCQLKRGFLTIHIMQNQTMHITWYLLSIFDTLIFQHDCQLKQGFLRQFFPHSNSYYAKSNYAYHLVSVEYLWNASVADSQLSGDDAWPDAGRRHLDDLEADVVGQGAPVDEHPAELVHPALACWGKYVCLFKNGPMSGDISSDHIQKVDIHNRPGKGINYSELVFGKEGNFKCCSSLQCALGKFFPQKTQFGIQLSGKVYSVSTAWVRVRICGIICVCE